MMKNAVPSIVTDSAPLRDDVKAVSSPGMSINTKTGPLPYLYVKSPHSAATAASPTTKSHFKDLPGDVMAVDAHDPQAISNFVSGDSLIIDIRPFNNYSASRLENAFNICIPTTLLKRPNYDLLHVTNSSALPKDAKDKLIASTTPTNVLIYDANSGTGHISFGLYQTIMKFYKHDRFTVAFLDGGFQELHTSLKDDSSLSSDQTPISPQTPSHPQLDAIRPDSGTGDHFAQSPAADSSRESSPFLSGFTLPSATASNQKMLMSIKKTLPRIDTSTSYNYNLRFPEGFEEKKDKLPKWLSFFGDGYGTEGHNEKVVGVLSEKFNKLERSEQVRLSMAISNTSEDSKDNLAPSNTNPARAHSGLSSGYCSPSAPCPHCDKIHYTIPKGVEYGYKNRYNNIWPYEHSRVKLVSSPSCNTPKKETTDDYFNANYIKCKQLSLTEYIATQSPLESTKEDFWNTVWYNGIKGIVCLNKPSVFAPPAYYEVDQFFEKSKLSVKIISSEDDSGFRIRKMEMEKRGKTRYVYHFAYTEWPDFGVPDNFDAVSRLLESKNEKLELLSEQKPPTSKVTRPLDLLVHCSAGCGRTGCFITLDMVKDCFKGKSNGKYDPWGTKDLVYKAVQLQRQQRIAMVQTVDQFIYCYESILHEIFKSYM
ncbi:hypothetical protein FT663_01915 [Candidozyma haemuli var. vulneris]|uniref:protein-tyrosine-phosphatase n=1 Tax=Candidozyma haemuli TaxID=45357 RepID=A0A2V1AUF6_9ASCO|nr:hypothetical protein CXQ85_000427 [[Candida] haemuloni]KAF3989767.1 hypothetical protein FT662_02642 [[Candida] haemuloni var. vulneris]KAF3993325.1 hypothetical protein FT663_01915 [[Candida] haemuloni var. vulneris]PVH21449.1 hypothetical protein CXQ85_000427 [[Candida] haemuloni]